MEKPRPRIHIVANCAHRKRVPPSAELGSISLTGIKKRAGAWWEKLNKLSNNLNDANLFRENNDKIKAKDLYVGSYWSKIRQLPDKARLSGFESDLWIVSAGYGLISSSDDIFSYSATFTPGDKNSVTNGESNSIKRAEILNHWWELISNYSLPESSNPRKLTRLIQENSGDYFLVILSGDYLSAVENDLVEGIQSLSSPENLVIVTSKSFSNETLQKNTVTVDARLQCNGDCAEKCEEHLVARGIRGSISASLAGKIIERAKEHNFNAVSFKQFVQNRIEKSPSLVNYNRTRLDDTTVCKFISEELDILPTASCTFLLRKLRNSGWACEQKRFREHYRSIKGMHYEK